MGGRGEKVPGFGVEYLGIYVGRQISVPFWGGNKKGWFPPRKKKKKNEMNQVEIDEGQNKNKNRIEIGEDLKGGEKDD